jgi:ATP-dependent DNA helicase RecG
MTPSELRERIFRWEDSHTDFKREIGHRDELGKDLVCFANGDGGQLIIGVDEGRNVVGVANPDALMLVVDDVAFNLCSPPLIVAPEVVMLDGVAVVVVNVPKGDQRPYATSNGRYYVRSGVRCRPASREQMLRMFQSTESLFYDEQRLTRLELGDLDLGAVSWHLADARAQDLGEDLPRLLRA